jgi:putative FmdB family regulatory protein
VPNYNYRCETCEADTLNVFRSLAEKDTRACPQCGNHTYTIISPVVSVGAQFSKPIVIGGLNRAFATNAEYRQWERENPDTHIVSTSSSDWERIKYNANNNAENVVQKWGFSSTHAWSEKAKKAVETGGSWTE